jgi:mannose-1-phosphate guanylyltransferase / mannose-6-phosphate isomerase
MLRKKYSGVVARSLFLAVAVPDCEDLMVVATSDAVLVFRKGKTEAVKPLVAAPKVKRHPEVEWSERQFEHWGYREILDRRTNYEVRRIVVTQ